MVDDEEQFRVTTARILTRRGYETTVAASGEEALEILRRTPQDVVILDIKMTGMDGHETLANIKKGRPEAQVIMLTGYGTLASAKQSRERDAFDYLNKPCDIDLLDSKIREAYAATHKEAAKEEKVAKDIMISIDDYTTIDVDSTIKEGIEQLKASFRALASTSRIMETGHRSIIVFEQGKKMVGILSIRDLIRGLQPPYLSAPKPSTADSMEYSPMFWTGLFTSQVKALKDKKVGELMSEPPPEVDESTNLMEVANLMHRKQVRRLIVASKGTVVGIVREQEIFFELGRILSERG
jgi:ActR/RegA family two-component response regulator